MVSDSLAKAILSKGKCHSVIGPNATIAFDDAAIFWASFYHIMFSGGRESMKMRELLSNLKKLTALFDTPISYYSKSESAKRGYRHQKIGEAGK